ncbi:MAG TPA: hypothetical protein VHE81_05090 [Lacipirellulaceae bacterium]|nr:hypothetical protein [Lacipirellulaceae bacterium]
MIEEANVATVDAAAAVARANRLADGTFIQAAFQNATDAEQKRLERLISEETASHSEAVKLARSRLGIAGIVFDANGSTAFYNAKWGQRVFSDFVELTKGNGWYSVPVDQILEIRNDAERMTIVEPGGKSQQFDVQDGWWFKCNLLGTGQEKEFRLKDVVAVVIFSDDAYLKAEKRAQAMAADPELQPGLTRDRRGLGLSDRAIESLANAVGAPQTPEQRQELRRILKAGFDPRAKDGDLLQAVEAYTNESFKDIHRAPGSP